MDTERITYNDLEFRLKHKKRIYVKSIRYTLNELQLNSKGK